MKEFLKACSQSRSRQKIKVLECLSQVRVFNLTLNLE